MITPHHGTRDTNQIRVLIVDDSVIYRAVLTSVFKKLPETCIAATSSNGMLAIEKLRLMKIDLVTLDIEMPVLDGIQTLEKIKNEFPDTAVIMVSSFTKKGADITLRALEMGAFDFITKPEENSREQNEVYFEQQLRILLRGIQTKMAFKAFRGRTVETGTKKAQTTPSAVPAVEKRPLSSQPATEVRPDVVAIGSSTGGPNALIEIIPRLPEKFPVPVLIVQHMPPVFTASLAESLNGKSKVVVVEAKDGDVIKAGTVYIAPGGKQMKVVTEAHCSGKKIKITDDPPENFCKPSVDYLFRSIAKEFAGKALGVILTGMGSDGTLGLRLMKRHNVPVIGQNEETCVVYGMPAEAKKAGVVDRELPVCEIASEIVKAVS